MDVKHAIGAMFVLLGTTGYSQECLDGQCKLKSAVQRIVDPSIRYELAPQSIDTTPRNESVLYPNEVLVTDCVEVAPVVVSSTVTTRYRTFKSQHKIRPMKRFNRCK
jgi:hypothetical protein